MEKKREFLPKEMNGLLEAGDVEGLKRIFAQCEPNALRSRSAHKDSNVFSLTPLPREFAVWAKEQGADVNFVDGYGYTPVFNHAGIGNGDVQLLIDLGAKTDITMYDGTTLLHEAAVAGLTDQMNVLLDNGAKVDVGMGLTWGTALESAIRQNSLPFDTLLEVCTLLLNRGAQITDKARKSLHIAGVRAEKTGKKKKDAALAEEQVTALNRLYELFAVDLEEEVDVHDGVPLLTIREIFKKEKGHVKPFHKFWGYLVPDRGRAQTAQGEVLRIVGRVQHEIMDNGSINWDDDFRKMLGILLNYFQLGNPLKEDTIESVERRIHALSDCGEGDKEIHYLLSDAVIWLRQNSPLIMPLAADYTR